MITGVGSGVDINNKNSFSDFFNKMVNFIHDCICINEGWNCKFQRTCALSYIVNT